MGGKGEGRWGCQFTQGVNEAPPLLDGLFSINLANLIQMLFTPWIIQQMSLPPEPLAAVRIKYVFIFSKIKNIHLLLLFINFACK